jgi:hypothetical protein
MTKRHHERVAAGHLRPPLPTRWHAGYRPWLLRWLWYECLWPLDLFALIMSIDVVPRQLVTGKPDLVKRRV